MVARGEREKYKNKRFDEIPPYVTQDEKIQISVKMPCNLLMPCCFVGFYWFLLYVFVHIL